MGNIHYRTADVGEVRGVLRIVRGVLRLRTRMGVRQESKEKGGNRKTPRGQERAPHAGTRFVRTGLNGKSARLAQLYAARGGMPVQLCCIRNTRGGRPMKRWKFREK
jgi:hypothetical protein